VLKLGVEIRSSDPDVLSAIEFVANDARQPEPATEHVTFSIQSGQHEHVVSVDGQVIDRAPSAAAVAETLFTQIQTRALRLFPHHALVRGAVLRDRGTRALLVGEPGAGITSLVVRMLHSGAAVEGDAFALLGADGVTPLPRRFMLRHGTEAVLPEFAGTLDSLPSAPSGLSVVWGYDPARAGFEWDIQRGAIAACVAIDPSHGADSRLLPLSATDAVRRVVARCSPPAEGGGSWLREVVRLLSAASCWRLVLGRLEDAVPALRQALL
jgi:hypothetical protein